VIDTEIASDPHLARVMLASLSRRLVGLIQDVEAYSLRSGMQRVIGYLLRDVDEHAEQPEGEPVRITLDANKGVIASRLNLTPEHFSRILGELSHEGAIAVKGAEITILDPCRLRSQLC
jgi:CRP-like cAMP-binding protein